MDDKLSEKPQTNEEVIDELTKNLKEACIKLEASGESENDGGDSVRKGTNLSDDPWENIGREPDAKDTEKPEPTERPEDYVDEKALIDREVELTESEKEKLRADAETLKKEGNVLFKAGEYKKAVIIYTQAIQTCPLAFHKDRSILYANRGAAKLKYMSDKESAIEDCTKAIYFNSTYTKAYLRRAQLYEETDKLDEALEDFKKVLTFDPANSEANYAVRRLPPLIHEKNEKLKTEMLGKLKDLGNMVLKPFGLSTDNFELQQDPNSGGYSVKFNQKAT